jgi:hypothetical protein
MNEDNNNLSLSNKIEKMFAGKDHVGVVKHFEGADLDYFVNVTRNLMKEIGKKYEDSIEVKKQRVVYNNLCYLSDNLYLWIKGTQTDFGILLEMKIYHPTELSGLSDELLNKFTEIFEKLMISS